MNGTQLHGEYRESSKFKTNREVNPLLPNQEYAYWHQSRMVKVVLLETFPNQGETKDSLQGIPITLLYFLPAFQCSLRSPFYSPQNWLPARDPLSSGHWVCTKRAHYQPLLVRGDRIVKRRENASRFIGAFTPRFKTAKGLEWTILCYTARIYYLHFEVCLWLLAGELPSSATNFRGKTHVL